MKNISKKSLLYYLPSVLFLLFLLAMLPELSIMLVYFCKMVINEKDFMAIIMCGLLSSAILVIVLWIFSEVKIFFAYLKTTK
jgi:hypothetical protein